MAKKSGSTPGDVVRYVPAPEPMVAVVAIFILTLVEVALAAAFIAMLLFSHNTIPDQQLEAFLLGSALLTLAAILSLYRKFFLPDVMLVKRRKLKYEDLM